MKYGVQVIKNESGWIAGIHQFKTKKFAEWFAEKLNKWGDIAKVVRKRDGEDWEVVE